MLLQGKTPSAKPLSRRHALDFEKTARPWDCFRRLSAILVLDMILSFWRIDMKASARPTPIAFCCNCFLRARICLAAGFGAYRQVGAGLGLPSLLLTGRPQLLICQIDRKQVPVAQLDRASASEAEGYKFEPCRGYFFSLLPFRDDS